MMTAPPPTRRRAGTTPSHRLAAVFLGILLIAAACGSDDTADPGAIGTSDTAAAADTAESNDSTTESATGAAGEEAAGEETGQPVASGGSVVFAAEQWPECLNPITSCANASWLNWSVTHHILPKLMELDSDGNYQASPVLTEAPSLANGLISEDPFTITFEIRDDAVWNDGTPITSEDVHFTWRAKLETTGSLSTTGYDLIDNIDTSDPKTAVITFADNYAPWADLFGGGTDYVLKASAFESTDVSADMLDDIRFSGGPWVLDRWGTEEAVLVRNDSYWIGERTPILDQVTFVPREDSDTEIIALQTGEVSAIFPQPSPGITDRLDQDDIEWEIAGGVVFEGLWLNQRSPQSPLLAELAVREALAYAIDRQQILDTVMKPIDPTAEVLQCGGWVPNVGPWCGDDFADIEQDFDRAAEILSDAGWARNNDGVWEKDGTPLEIEWNTVAGNRRREDVQALVQEQVADFGIRFVINNLDAGELFQNRLPRLEFGMGLYANVASPDPTVTVIYDREQIPTEENEYTGQNFLAWDNAEATELAALSDRQLDPAERLQSIRRIGELVRQDVAWIPLYQLPNLTAWRTDVLEGPIGEFTASSYGGFANMYDWALVR